jgi:hypothetical protein
MELTKQFTGKLNLDTVTEMVPEGDYTFLNNAVIGTSKDGKRGAFESVMGTTALSGISDMTNGFCIGGCRDFKSDDYYLFFYNADPSKNCIVRVNGTTVTKILTWSGLNFSNNINYRIQAVFVNNYLYFTDNYNPPRGFNIYNTSGTIKYASSSPSSEEEISLIKRGPIYAPSFTKITDATVAVNLIFKNDFQFTYQYVYNDGQLSVVAPYSKLCQRNISTDTFNKIRVSIPTSPAESIPSDVKEIKFAVRVGNDSGFQYIGTLYRSTNNFATTYIDFFNTVYGGPVGVDYLNTSHDIPVKSKCLEFIKNRMWLGNVTDGYDIPASPNMNVYTNAVNVPQQGDPILTPNTTFYYVNRYDYTVTNLGGGLIQISNTNIATNIAILYQGVLESDLRSVNGKEVSLVTGAYEITNPNYDQNGTVPLQTIGLGLVPFGANTSVTISGTTPPTTYVAYRLGSTFTGTLRTFASAPTVYNGQRTFPSGSQYKVGLIYKDESGRSSSVVLANQDISTSYLTYTNLHTVQWDLPLGVNLNIPSWARSYHIVRTRNLTKSIFFEWKACDIHYASDSNQKHYTYDPNHSVIHVDIEPITNLGFGYSFQDGDRIIIYGPDGSTTYNLQISGYTAGTIKIPLTNIGAITNVNPTFEIYRPNVISEDLLYYEIGQGYTITNAGTSSRQFSVTSGSLDGDCVNALLPFYDLSGASYVIVSDVLFKEMSVDPKDVSWNTDIGKAYLVSSIGQVVRPYTFKHSAPVISDTEVNGLSEFYAADQSLVPFECGEIFKLKSSSRVASDGTVLLAICRNKPVSIYVDESRLNITNEVNYIVNGSQVIGEVNTLNGSFGTIHPDSVFDDGNFVYWYSHNRRAFVRYGTNGVFPVSKYGVEDYFEDQSKLNDGTDLVIGGYFPFYDLVIVSFENAPSTALMTLSYMDKDSAWRSFFAFSGQHFFDVRDNFYSVKNGIIYIHNNTSAYGFLQGQQHFTKITVPLNVYPDVPKMWQTVQLHLSPDFIEWVDGEQRVKTSGVSDLKIEIANDNSQFTDVFRGEFEIDEYIAYAPIKKDENSTGEIANGDDMVSRTALLSVYFKGDNYRYIPFLKVGYIPSMGHTL